MTKIPSPKEITDLNAIKAKKDLIAVKEKIEQRIVAALEKEYRPGEKVVILGTSIRHDVGKGARHEIIVAILQGFRERDWTIRYVRQPGPLGEVTSYIFGAKKLRK